MGCGCGSKRESQYIEAHEDLKPLGVVQPKTSNEESAKSLNPDTSVNTTNELKVSAINNSALNTAKCATCLDPNQKNHTLECTHAICIQCTKQQAEDQIKKKQNTTTFICCTCKAPKSLSN